MIGQLLCCRWRVACLATAVVCVSLGTCVIPAFGSDKAGKQTTDLGCLSSPIWNERFRYAEKLASAGKYSDEKAVLEPALSDGCPAVRYRALRALQEAIAADNPRDWISVVWRQVEPKLNGVLAVVLWIALASILLALMGVLSRFLNRRSIAVRPLTVSNGSGFDGQHFVAIAQEMDFKLRLLQTGIEGLPSSSAAAPKMLLDSVTLADDVLGVLADDQTGKLVAAISGILRRPRYICSGSIHFAGRCAHIVIRLQKGNKIVETWERFSQTARLIEDLKDLSYLGLEAARSELRR